MTAPVYPLTPDGRWSRILEACRTRALTKAQLLDQLHDGRHSRNRERKKIQAACLDLQDRGLLTRADRHAYLTTTAGADALDALSLFTADLSDRVRRKP